VTLSPADPDFREEIGNGLIRRWSTAADQPHIGYLMASVFRDSAESPLNIRAADESRIIMGPGFPFMGPGDFALIEAPGRSEHPLVACTCYFRHQWSMAGIQIPVGRPEIVATDPAYRNRGLVRALFEMVHARSAADGNLVDAITGIPYFYRQFGYEYVLDLDGHRRTPLELIPEKKGDEPDPFTLRDAILADVPDLMALYSLPRQQSLVWHEAPEPYWRHLIEVWDDPAIQQQDVTANGLQRRLHMIVDREGRTCGYAYLATRRWDANYGIVALQLAAHCNWQTAAPALLRLLRSHAETVPAVAENKEAFKALNFRFGRSHPLYEVLGEELAPHVDLPYAWYLRVPDLAAFLRHIAPVLEGRLAASILTGHTGEVKLDCYRGGLRLVFEQGRLAEVAPWRPPAYGDHADVGCPALTLLQLLFGYRALAELKATFPDVWAKPEATLLLNVLFPKLPSTLHVWG
jgi:GNAT superfamily N-acetyltransferase